MNGLIATIGYGVHAPDKIIFQLMIYGARTRWQFRRPTELSPPGGTNFPSDGSTVGGEVRKCEHDVNQIIETIKNSTLTTLTRLAVCNPFTQSRAEKKNVAYFRERCQINTNQRVAPFASKLQGTTQTYRCHIAINFAEHSVVIFREF